jgi:hypothetical protein
VSWAIERLTPAHIQSQLALLGSTVNAICILQGVELP